MLNVPVERLSDENYNAMIKRLMKTRILRKYVHNSQSSYTESTFYYNVQPLIRAHYLECFQKLNQAEFQRTHKRIADYYSENLPKEPRREDITYIIEAVHHLCQAQEFDKAWGILSNRLATILSDGLAAWDIYLDLHLGFFPNRDFTQDPQVNATNAKASILNNTGLGFSNLGLSSNSISLYERGISAWRECEEWVQTSKTLHNLTFSHLHNGDLKSAVTSIQQGFSYLNHRSSQIQDQWQWEKHRMFCTQARISFLKGDMKLAGEFFQNAEDLIREIEPDKLYLYSQRGVHYADYLRRSRQLEKARQVIEENLKISEQRYWLEWISCCHRFLGDLSADEKQHEVAKDHYQEALKIIHNTVGHDYLIEVLSARGRWAAKYMIDVETSQADLSQARDYALSSGYRLYEADIRVGMAWKYLSASNSQKAKEEAKLAWKMSEEMGYYWGKVDATEVLEKLENM
jgi:tetratricopeptide (TPR) repeat protein